MSTEPKIMNFAAISEFKNPFNKKCIDRVYIELRPNNSSSFSRNVEISVWFKNGDTRGNQYFKGDSLEEVMPRVEAFVNGLNEGVAQ